MTVYIPQLADKLTLIQPWTFKLYLEYRNNTFIQAAGLIKYFLDHGVPITTLPKFLIGEGHYTFKGNPTASVRPIEEVTLPTGTVLGVERIFIRKGSHEYNSLTFNVIKGTVHNITTKDGHTEIFTHNGRVRFWAKLQDVNEMYVVS